MRSEFEVYIKDSYNEHISELLGKAFELFDDYNLPNYQDQYLGIIMQTTIDDQQHVADLFLDTVTSDLLMLVAYHGISVNEGTSIENLIIVLQGLLVLQNYEDAACIISYLEEDGSNEDVFCNLLGLVTEKHSVYFSTFIGLVRPTFKTLMLEMYKDKANDSKTDGDPDKEAIAVNIKRLQYLKTYDQLKSTSGFTLISNGIPIGMPFVAYASQSKELLEIYKTDDLVKELVVLLAMSSDGIINPQQTYRNWSDNFFDNLTKITEVDIALGKILAELETLALTNPVTQ